MNTVSITADVAKLRPRIGEVVVVDLNEDATDEELGALSRQLDAIASQTRATVLLLPKGVTVDVIDEREMLARGWLRVGSLCHTAEQLASPVPEADPPTLSP